jgi:hypothetical protein
MKKGFKKLIVILSAMAIWCIVDETEVFPRIHQNFTYPLDDFVILLLVLGELFTVWVLFKRL